MIPWVDVIIVALSIAGLADALYFTFAYYGRIKKARWIPKILCAREGSSCVTVVQTPYARVLGVPNSLLGILYYLAIMAWIPWSNTRHGAGPGTREFMIFTAALLFASGGSVVMGFYLIHSLRRKLHIDCPLCYTAHAINLILFILLVVYYP